MLFHFLYCEKDFLNVVPDNIATIDLAFNNRATAERFLSTCYTYIPEHAHAEQNFSLVAGDEIWYYAENDFNDLNSRSFRRGKWWIYAYNEAKAIRNKITKRFTL